MSDPHRLADTAVAGGGLQGAVDDAVDPEDGRQQHQDQKHPRHDSHPRRVGSALDGVAELSAGIQPRRRKARAARPKTGVVKLRSARRLLRVCGCWRSWCRSGILMLLPILREYYWLAAIFAALIGLSLSLLFLRRPLDDVSPDSPLAAAARRPIVMREATRTSRMPRSTPSSADEAAGRASDALICRRRAPRQPTKAQKSKRAVGDRGERRRAPERRRVRAARGRSTR